MRLWFNLFCRDIEALMRYYQALLGLPEAEQSRSPIYRAVQAPGFQLGFNAHEAYGLLGLSERAPVGTQPWPVTGYATFMLDDSAAVDQAAVRAAALGGYVIKPPYPTYYGQWQAVLADPEDNVFRISAVGLPDGVGLPTLAV